MEDRMKKLVETLDARTKLSREQILSQSYCDYIEVSTNEA